MSEPTIEQLLESALRFHRAAAPADAQRIYRQILTRRPDHDQALHLLGVVLLQTGDPHAAVEFLRRAIAVNPAIALYHNNLAKALFSDGQLDDSIAAYRQSLRLNPGSAEACNDLGTALCAKQKLEQAIAAYDQAIRIKPDFAAAHNNLGNALMEQGQLDKAQAAYRCAIQIAPDYAEAHFNLANILRDNKKFDDAIAAYRQAISVKPGLVEAHVNLGNLLLRRGRGEDAIAAYRHALDLKPEYADAHNNLGNALKTQGHLEAAIHSFRQAIRLKPDYALAHLNLGFALLLRGDFDEGWREHEWRLKIAPARQHPALAEPRWNGQELHGQTVLLLYEQGVGDIIQFARYAPLLSRRGGCPIIQCQPELVRLLRSNPDLGQVISTDAAPPRFDLQCSIVSLPMVFHANLESIPTLVPYLSPEPALVDAWKHKLSLSRTGLNVGLAWAGNPLFQDDQTRSMSLRQLAPLGAMRSARFYGLQKGYAEEEANHPPPGLELVNLGPELNDFADTAAVMSLMDLIITTDTSVPHLAGALGRPVWVMLQFVPDFRWLLQREDSPWYPTMRLFRQKSIGDWAGVIDRVAKSLLAFQ